MICIFKPTKSVCIPFLLEMASRRQLNFWFEKSVLFQDRFPERHETIDCRLVDNCIVPPLTGNCLLLKKIFKKHLNCLVKIYKNIRYNNMADVLENLN